MKRRALIALSILLLAAAPVAAGSLPPPQSFVLANGITVLLHTDNVLPLVSFRLLLPGAGTASEKADGLADLSAAMLLKGTATRSAATASPCRPKRPGHGLPVRASGAAKLPRRPRKAALSPSASATTSVQARALTYGKLVFQWPQRWEPTSHMWERAKTAFRETSRSHSRKSFVNSRRGDGVTPQFHSTKATSSSLR